MEGNNMTLTEYINQVDPIRNPNVVLEKNEFITSESIWNGVEKLTFIEIPALYTKYRISGNYIQIDDRPELYTMSDDGNVKRLSCFRLG